MALERIVLNIIPEGEMPVFHCSQYENGRPVIIDLVSSDDDAFLIPEGATVELHCRKVDDNIVTLEPDEVDNNTVTFVSTEQLTACPGDNLCEVVLYADTDPVKTIATLNFILHVEPDPLEGGLTSETQIYNLTQQVEEITQQVIGDDYYNKTEVDDLLDDKADKATTYTKSEVDTALNLKADKSTTYTKSQVDSALALKADKSDTYTKTQVDNALALKANTADLATVATTGDYDDLINKPSIPAAQVQSDYAQADNTQVDYIKNKPDINAMIAAALLEVMPVGTASGPIASFDTELAVPLVNVLCDIVATGGNGTPDNPNPINGYTEAKITRCGKNLFNGIYPSIGTLKYMNIFVGKGTFTMSTDLPTRTDTFANLFFLANKVSSGADSALNGVYNNRPVTVTSTDGYVTLAYRYDEYNPQNYHSQIEFGNQATAYEPYNGQTFTVSFGQTVYGGVLDITRGKLKPCIEYPSYNGETLSGRWLSSEATYVEGTTPPTGSQVVSLDDYGSDIDLTPEVISAVVGENNIYSDTNGDTTVQYKDSIQHYIDQRT
jgi:hypothetical protein